MHPSNLILLTVFAVLGQLSQVMAQENGPYRKLAPGVLKIVQPEIEEDETFSGPRKMVELLTYDLPWQPKTLPDSETLATLAENVTFRRQIWGLEFGFKPLRMIEAEVRGPDGVIRREPVHYLVYYVKNNGNHLNPAPEEDDYGNVTFRPEEVQHTIRCFPTFKLQAHDVGRAYMDDILPDAMARIRQREDPNRTFYDSVSIGSVTIPVSSDMEDNRVWGVVTWRGLDPRSDFFSVYIQGLTNAYRWVDPEGAYQAGDEPLSGRKFSFKTLQLNFWRAGDAVEAEEAEIRYGLPNENEVPANRTANDVLELYQVKERVDHLWVYR